MAQVDVHSRAVFDARQARRQYRRVSADLAAVRGRAGRHDHPHRDGPGPRLPALPRYPDVLVVAIAHDRRRPAYWSRRLP